MPTLPAAPPRSAPRSRVLIPRPRPRPRPRFRGRTGAKALLLAAVLLAGACNGSDIGSAVIPQLPGNENGGGGSGGGGTGQVQGQAIDAFGSDVVTAINDARTPLGLPALTVDPKLVAAAQLQANQMKQTGVFQHTISGVTYPTVTDRVDATGYAWSSVGESLATGTNASQIVNGWRGVTEDRANLLSTTYTAVGVAEAINGAGTQLVVAVFAKPNS